MRIQIETITELENILRDILFQVWSIQSSSKWTTEVPARGQCGVTALVVHDLLGGEIVKTCLAEGWHFYNLLNGKRYDFTESQFESEIHYVDQLSTREEAFSDTNEDQYHYLRNRVFNCLAESSFSESMDRF